MAAHYQHVPGYVCCIKEGAELGESWHELQLAQGLHSGVVSKGYA